jgi:hypothetical protein
MPEPKQKQTFHDEGHEEHEGRCKGRQVTALDPVIPNECEGSEKDFSPWNTLQMANDLL